ncbi:MAG: GTP-binding protein, partial [Gammaproteobacteria bacterium]
MFGEKHDLIHELPEHKERIHQLKISDEHFSKLFDEYHELDHQILRMEE